MSMDRSLKSASALVRHRNVLTRAERMARLQDEEKWAPGRSIFGLPKVANRKMEVGKVVKEETAEGATPVAGATAAPAAAGAKGAAPAGKGAPAATKGAAPAAGAKGAGPAAKGAAPAKAAAPAAKKK
jgi:small basic protein (TIGR04137 family)